MHRLCGARIRSSQRVPSSSIRILATAAVAAMLVACAAGPRSLESIPVSDPGATDETRALFMKLWLLSHSEQTLFGHQADLAYGVGWRAVPGRSDVLETSGSYPAVYGWDVGGMELGDESNAGGVRFDDMRAWIIEAYKRGGVNTISWHMNNPVTGGDFYDRTPAVSTLLPGGSNHDWYRSALDSLAEFLASLEVEGTDWNPEPHLVPIVFRPFHEHNIGAFWWTLSYASVRDYVALWRFTIEYLRLNAGVHNLLYAYSPDRRGIQLSRFSEEYFIGYPGDAYIDVLGLDNYLARPTHLDDFKYTVGLLLAEADERFKIAAITETGRETVPEADWWTEFLLPVIRASATRQSHGQPAWALVWRNAGPEHHYAPHSGHASVPDFRDFRESGFVVFEDEIPYELYEWP